MFAYDARMGHMKRAEARERLLRTRLRSTYSVVLSWRTDGPDLLLNVLDPKTRLPLTSQRVLRDPETIAGMVDRSIRPLRADPREIAFRRALAAGWGEIEVEISGVQFALMRGQ